MAAPIDLSTLSSLEQQCYVAGLELQKAEAAVPEEERPDRATVEFSVEENTVTITISLDTETDVTNGQAVISAKPYLFDLASNGN